MSDTQSFEDPTVEEKLSLGVHAAALIVVSVVALVGNTVATDNTVPEGLVGLIVLWLICMVGLLLTEFVPFKLPSVAWISLGDDLKLSTSEFPKVKTRLKLLQSNL